MQDRGAFSRILMTAVLNNRYFSPFRSWVNFLTSVTGQYNDVFKLESITKNLTRQLKKFYNLLKCVQISLNSTC